MILGYLPIVAPETLKKWKIAITSVGQGYESTEGQNDYKTGIRMTYRGQGHQGTSRLWMHIYRN